VLDTSDDVTVAGLSGSCAAAAPPTVSTGAASPTAAFLVFQLRGTWGAAEQLPGMHPVLLRRTNDQG